MDWLFNLFFSRTDLPNLVFCQKIDAQFSGITVACVCVSLQVLFYLYILSACVSLL